MKTPMSADKARQDAGYTLIELLVVLAILTIVMAGAVSFVVRSQDTASAERIAQNVAAMMRVTATKAMTRQEDFSVTIDLEAHEISAWNLDTIEVPSNMVLEVVTAKSEVYRDDLVGIRFFSQGGSTGGQVVVIDEYEAQVIEIDWLTGMPTVWRRNDETH
jgi:general secretion pathway protein H